MLRLQSVSVESVLRRGFAWVRNEHGQTVYNLEQARQTHNFEIQFYDGCWRSENGLPPPESKNPPAPRKKPSNRGKPMNCKSICLTISLFCFFPALPRHKPFNSAARPNKAKSSSGTPIKAKASSSTNKSCGCPLPENF